MSKSDLQKKKKEEPITKFDGEFSREMFPLLANGLEYDIQEMKIDYTYKKRSYERLLSVGIVFKNIYRYEMFQIKLTQDATFPVLFRESNNYSHSVLNTSKTLQRRIDEIVTSVHVREIIKNAEDAVKNGELETLKEGYLEIKSIKEMADVRRLAISGLLMHVGEKRVVSMQVQRLMGNWKYHIFDDNRRDYIKAPLVSSNYEHDEFVWNQIWNDDKFQVALDTCSFKEELMTQGSLIFKPSVLESWFNKQ